MAAPQSVALIVSTYNQPMHLRRCLCALERQSHGDFELLLADDGSGEETRELVAAAAERFGGRLRHLWQEDRGFRKTRILNRAMLATDAEYLVFMDGDCVAHPDFLREHLRAAARGHYLNGAMLRLTPGQTAAVNEANIASGEVFDSNWLTRSAGRWNRRYLKLSLPYGLRRWLNEHSTTKLYWLGANSSCYRADAVAVNGFDNRFAYGFEDGDFGNRLENLGLKPTTVRWTANVLHLDHGRPYRDREREERQRALMARVGPGERVRSPDGLEELARMTPAEADSGAGA
jgi:glycosyltransferase involved in cell wall biosynthesis